MPNNFQNGLHISINHEGRVSLWDSMRAAMDGKEDGEIATTIVLTDRQLNFLEGRQKAARAPLVKP